MEKKLCWSCRIYWWKMDKSKASSKITWYCKYIRIIFWNLKHPVLVPQLNPRQKVSRWKSVHKITARRNTFGFFTSLTILHNLFHPGKNTTSLIVPTDFLNFTHEFWHYFSDITDTPWYVAIPHWNHSNARLLYFQDLRLNFLTKISWLFFICFCWFLMVSWELDVIYSKIF